MGLGRNDPVADSIGLLISILVRYPEVGTINYEPKTHVLTFTFVLLCLLPDEQIDGFQTKLFDCLKTFNYLEAREPQVINLSSSVCRNFTVMEIRRDVETLSQNEISLIVSLIRQEFREDLVTEESDSLVEEEMLLQEELIGHMLENMKGAVPEKKLIAFREEGRVLVFNK